MRKKTRQVQPLLT